MSLPQPSAADPLRPVALRDLRLQSDGRRWRVDQPIAGLDSLTPVRGELMALHHGSVLELQGRAETIVTLCCDRCLQSFNHQLSLEVRELIDLDPDGGDGGSIDGVHARLIDDDSAAGLCPTGSHPRSCTCACRWSINAARTALARCAGVWSRNWPTPAGPPCVPCATAEPSLPWAPLWSISSTC